MFFTFLCVYFLFVAANDIFSHGFNLNNWKKLNLQTYFGDEKSFSFRRVFSIFYPYRWNQANWRSESVQYYAKKKVTDCRHFHPTTDMKIIIFITRWKCLYSIWLRNTTFSTNIDFQKVKSLCKIYAHTKKKNRSQPRIRIPENDFSPRLPTTDRENNNNKWGCSMFNLIYIIWWKEGKKNVNRFSTTEPNTQNSECWGAMIEISINIIGERHIQDTK